MIKRKVSFMLNEMEVHNTHQPLSLVAQLVKDITNIADQMRLLDQKFVELDPANKTEVEKFSIEESKLWDSYREKSNTLMELKKKVRNLDLKHKKSPGYRPYSSDIQVVFPPVMHGTIREENVEIKGWEIHENEIKIDFQSPLGEGTYASVYKGKCRGKHVAVKIMKGDLSREALQEFKHEVSISSKLRHENLLLFMGICTDGGQLKILTELMPRGNLSSLLRTEKLSMTRKMLIAQDVALGMCWLHKQGIYHFDLKPPNLFIGDNWVVKVADFGISQFKDNITAIGGTLNYLAPEVLTGDQKTEMLNKVDVYAFGMILWEILTGQTPWHKQLRSIPEFVRNVGAEGKRLPIPEDCPPLLRKLITDCWAQNPESRPTFEYIVEANIFPQIIIESCIASDPDGQAFWKRHFDNAIQVPWLRFLNGFATYFNIQLPRSHEVDPKLTCLKMAMGDGETVSAEQFGNSLAWYGPLRRGQVQAFLDRVYNIWSFEGFFGEFGREEAERKLVDEKPGSLLIRLSSIPGHFAISARTKAGVFKHFKVMYANETFQFDDERPCTSLEQVITIVKKANKLKYIAVGSKFKQNIVLKQQEDNRDPSSYTKIETKSKTKK